MQYGLKDNALISHQALTHQACFECRISIYCSNALMPALWAAGQAAAEAATAELADSIDPGEMTEEDVHAAVQRALAPLGFRLPD